MNVPFSRVLASALVIGITACKSEPAPALPPVCTEPSTEFQPAPIETVVLNAAPRTETKSNAGLGSAVGGALAGGAALVTGGASVPLASLGGSAVGAYAGSTDKVTIVTEDVRTCSFRITVQGQMMVYYGDKEELNTMAAAAAFQKCTMLRPGDLVTPVLTCTERNTAYPDGLKTFVWTSGPTAGFLL